MVRDHPRAPAKSRTLSYVCLFSVVITLYRDSTQKLKMILLAQKSPEWARHRAVVMMYSCRPSWRVGDVTHNEQSDTNHKNCTERTPLEVISSCWNCQHFIRLKQLILRRKYYRLWEKFENKYNEIVKYLGNTFTSSKSTNTFWIKITSEFYNLSLDSSEEIGMHLDSNLNSSRIYK